MARYKNKFWREDGSGYGPEFYETDAKPIEHHGLLIYRRLKECFDIVDDGICISQYAGINGAKNAIETRFGHTNGADR
nr:hypothetical protein [uncultured Cohaesibacter sp.]